MPPSPDSDHGSSDRGEHQGLEVDVSTLPPHQDSAHGTSDFGEDRPYYDHQDVDKIVDDQDQVPETENLQCTICASKEDRINELEEKNKELEEENKELKRKLKELAEVADSNTLQCTSEQDSPAVESSFQLPYQSQNESDPTSDTVTSLSGEVPDCAEDTDENSNTACNPLTDPGTSSPEKNPNPDKNKEKGRILPKNEQKIIATKLRNLNTDKNKLKITDEMVTGEMSFENFLYLPIANNVFILDY